MKISQLRINLRKIEIRVDQTVALKAVVVDALKVKKIDLFRKIQSQIRSRHHTHIPKLSIMKKEVVLSQLSERLITELNRRVLIKTLDMTEILIRQNKSLKKQRRKRISTQSLLFKLDRQVIRVLEVTLRQSLRSLKKLNPSFKRYSDNKPTLGLVTFCLDFPYSEKRF